MGIFDDSGVVEQGFMKVMIYGGPGAGKTCTALKVCTAIGKTAIVDTERGTEPFRTMFYNPDGSPFSVVRTRAPYAVVDDVIPEALKLEFKCLIVDQATTIWDDAKDQYILKEYEKQSKAWQFIDKNGKLPFQAWTFIKKPFRTMIRELLNAPMHVFILSRLADEYEILSSGEPKKLGERADAEKNTQYEPATLIKMEYDKKTKKHLAWCEKDRWGVLEGQVCENPDVEFFRPILAKLGPVHGKLPEPAVVDTEVVEGPKSAQIILIRKLAEKGGVTSERVEEVLSRISREEAAKLINQFTLGDFSGIK